MFESSPLLLSSWSAWNNFFFGLVWKSSSVLYSTVFYLASCSAPGHYPHFLLAIRAAGSHLQPAPDIRGGEIIEMDENQEKYIYKVCIVAAWD